MTTSPASAAAAETITPTMYLRLVLLGAAIGIPAAVVAGAFLAFVDLAQDWLWEDLPAFLGKPEPPSLLVVAIPVAGAIVVLAARRLLPGDGGHRPLEGVGGGVTPLRNAPGVALAAIGTLAFGAVLGPEAPLVAIGSAVGMAVTLAVRLGPREEAVMATAGSFSAISALFGGPIVGAMLMVEGGIERGRALIPILLPGFVASGVGYVIFVGIRSWPGLEAPGLAIPSLPPYVGTDFVDLAIAIVVGAVTAIVLGVIRRAASGIEVRGLQRLGMPALLVAGGIGVGLTALVAGGLGADPRDVLFSGQSAVPTLAAQTSADVVLILLFAKGLAYAICLGCGFRGGPVFPAIFVGIAIAMLPSILFGMSPTAAVAIGAAAGVVAMTGLLVTAVLFASLLVGQAGVDAVPAAVMAASSAWLISRALERRQSPVETTTEVGRADTIATANANRDASTGRVEAGDGQES
jgi:H+/Cl- antiporter ClcA